MFRERQFCKRECSFEGHSHVANALYSKTGGAFHSTKTFENLETAANGTEISWKSFQKFRKLLNFRNANHSTENFRNSGNGKKTSGKFISKIWVYLARLSSFFGNVRKSSLPVQSTEKCWLFTIYKKNPEISVGM